MKRIEPGTVFGELTVERISDVKKKNKQIQYVCKCSCGKEKIAGSYELRHGKTTHCGCKKSENLSLGLYKHGCEPKRLHEMWTNMKTRCNNPNYSLYSRYGGRGIRVCKEWEDSFYNFKTWALSHGYADNLSIDRIDNDKGYCPDNCRFTTCVVQSNNRRTNRFVTVHGVTDTLANTARRMNVKYASLQYLLNKGYSGDESIRRLTCCADNHS